MWNIGLKNVKEHLKMMGQSRQASQVTPPNRYCACSSLMCNCCRDFSLPVVPIKGPGKFGKLIIKKSTLTFHKIIKNAINLWF